MTNGETRNRDTGVLPAVLRATVLAAQGDPHPLLAQQPLLTKPPPCTCQAGFGRPDVCASELRGRHQLKLPGTASGGSPECRRGCRKRG